jgi:hypothetical protein
MRHASAVPSFLAALLFLAPLAIAQHGGGSSGSPSGGGGSHGGGTSGGSSSSSSSSHVSGGSSTHSGSNSGSHGSTSGHTIKPTSRSIDPAHRGSGGDTADKIKPYPHPHPHPPHEHNWWPWRHQTGYQQNAFDPCPADVDSVMKQRAAVDALERNADAACHTGDAIDCMLAMQTHANASEKEEALSRRVGKRCDLPPRGGASAQASQTAQPGPKQLPPRH